MPTPTAEQIAKLPLWAQSHIALLELRLGETRETLDKLATPVDGNTEGVYVNDYSDAHLPFRMVKTEGVRITTGRHKIDISSRAGSGLVRISFNCGDCDSTLAVLPQASNCVYLVATPSPKRQ